MSADRTREHEPATEEAAPAAEAPASEARGRTQFKSAGSIPPVGGGFTPPKSTADAAFGTLQMKPKQEPKQTEEEKLEDNSRNATYNAMNSSLVVVARYLDKANREMGARFGLVRDAKKGSADYQDAVAYFSSIISQISGRLEGLRSELKELGYTQGNDFVYIESGTADLQEASGRLSPLINELNAWATPDGVGDIDSALGMLFNQIAPPANPLTASKPTNPFAPSKPRQTGGNDIPLLVERDINMQIDAGMAGARALEKNGNVAAEHRIKVALREIARLAPAVANMPLGPTFKPRLDELRKAIAKAEVEQPWTKPFIDEVLELIKDVK